MQYTYRLVNADHLTDDQIANIERGLEMRAFVCQQEFEKAIDLYHEINVIPEADDEAQVTKIEIKDDECRVDLDCDKVRFS